MTGRITNRDVRYFVTGQPEPEQPTYADLRVRVAALEAELQQARAIIRRLITVADGDGYIGAGLYDDAHEFLNKE